MSVNSFALACHPLASVYTPPSLDSWSNVKSPSNPRAFHHRCWSDRSIYWSVKNGTPYWWAVSSRRRPGVVPVSAASSEKRNWAVMWSRELSGFYGSLGTPARWGRILFGMAFLRWSRTGREVWLNMSRSYKWSFSRFWFRFLQHTCFRFNILRKEIFLEFFYVDSVTSKTGMVMCGQCWIDARLRRSSFVRVEIYISFTIISRFVVCVISTCPVLFDKQKETENDITSGFSDYFSTGIFRMFKLVLILPFSRTVLYCPGLYTLFKMKHVVFPDSIQKKKVSIVSLIPRAHPRSFGWRWPMLLYKFVLSWDERALLMSLGSTTCYNSALRLGFCCSGQSIQLLALNLTERYTELQLDSLLRNSSSKSSPFVIIWLFPLPPI